jgi:hypothetical protein
VVDGRKSRGDLTLGQVVMAHARKDREGKRCGRPAAGAEADRGHGEHKCVKEPPDAEGTAAASSD